MPVHPTNAVSNGTKIWETAVEFDPLHLYIMMLGGPGDSGVQCVLRGSTGCSLSAKNVFLSAKNPGGSYTTALSVPLFYPKQ